MMTKDIGFVAKVKQSGKFVFNLDEGVTSKYLSDAKVYVSYSDWRSDIRESENFDWSNIIVRPVEMKLMT